jgi:hypothetical protein
MAFFVPMEDAEGHQHENRWWNLEQAIRVEVQQVKPAGGSRVESVVAIKFDFHEAGVLILRHSGTVAAVKAWVQEAAR